MPNKVLFIATTAKTHINTFHLPYIQWFKKQGWIVESATNGDAAVPGTDKEYALAIHRNPFALGNIKALVQLIQIMCHNNYQMISCHTPMGGVLGRVAAKLTHSSPVFYMAHGFHFYSGAPLISCLVYKNIERILARWTDVLITINDEDYKAGKKLCLKKNGKLYRLNGIGARTEDVKENKNYRNVMRESLHINNDTVIVLTVAEMSPGKNYDTSIRAFVEANLNDAVYLICGAGKEEKRLKELVHNLGQSERILFLGYRNDIMKIVNCADIFLFASQREGLPISVIEAMAAGLPIVASNVRGNRDLVDDGLGGFLIEVNSISAFAEKLSLLYEDVNIRADMGNYNSKKSDKYSVASVMRDMITIFSENGVQI